ncbi:MAG: hypothetical protein IKO47_00735 [Ruminococcus sp.]|nr:hypothetical protein [Ruminococcus sp.]
MRRFFANVWTKRAFSLLSVFYAAGAFILCWFSLFYDIHIHGRVSQCLIITAISIISLVLMLYTRKQIVTRIVSFLILPAMLPVVLLYFGEWGMIIPIIVTGLLILLLSGAGEGIKTAIGTVTLLLYVFAALGYFLITSFFVISDKTEVVAEGESPSGRYRYRVVNTITEDPLNGSTSVYVEPNYADKEFLFATFTLKDMERVVDLTRPASEEIKIEWKTQSRAEITAELNARSEHIVVRLSDKALEKLGITDADHYTLYGISSKQKRALGKKESDFNDILLTDIPDDKLSEFNLAKDEGGNYYVLSPTKEFLQITGFAEGTRIYLRDLTEQQLRAFHIIVDNAIYLNTLTDAQLEQLGVPESGDVMYFNGEICFRYYVAEIEEYFDTESRHFSLDLLE